MKLSENWWTAFQVPKIAHASLLDNSRKAACCTWFTKTGHNILTEKMDQIRIDLRTYFRNSSIQEIDKIQEQLVIQLKSKKVDPEVLDVEEFARIGLIDSG